MFYVFIFILNAIEVKCNRSCKMQKRGAVAWSISCLLYIQLAQRLILAFSAFFYGDFSPSSADSRRAICPLLVKKNGLLIASRRLAQEQCD